VDPRNGSVLFASAEHGWCVSLESMALLSGGDKVRGRWGAAVGVETDALRTQDLRSKLWGDVFFDPATRAWSASSSGAGGPKRSFVHFVLEPLYKIYAHVLGSDAPHMQASLGISLSAKQAAMDAPALLRCVLRKIFPVRCWHRPRLSWERTSADGRRSRRAQSCRPLRSWCRRPWWHRRGVLRSGGACMD
jgi:U5 small nuclear ribonucleoprotein component